MLFKTPFKDRRSYRGHLGQAQFDPTKSRLITDSIGQWSCAAFRLLDSAPTGVHMRFSPTSMHGDGAGRLNVCVSAIKSWTIHTHVDLSHADQEMAQLDQQHLVAQSERAGRSVVRKSNTFESGS